VHEEHTAVQGYHVYRHVWKPTIGEKLHAEQDLNNTVKKIKNQIIYLASTREFCGMLSHMVEG